MTGQPPGNIVNLVAHSLTATTISLTWDVTGDIFIERFEVSYSYTVNTCIAPAGSGMVTISDGTRRSHTLSGLNEDSQYTITVTGIISEGRTSNTARRITTSIQVYQVCYRLLYRLVHACASLQVLASLIHLYQYHSDVGQVKLCRSQWRDNWI